MQNSILIRQFPPHFMELNLWLPSVIFNFNFREITYTGSNIDLEMVYTFNIFRVCDNF